MVRILVIDDSAFSRRAIVRMLESSPEILVVGTARDGEEGLRKVRELRPDVVTLDLAMPNLDGFGFLRIISRTHSLPVLVVSSRSEAASVFTALELGATDFILKPPREASPHVFDMQEELCARVKLLAQVEASRLRRSTEAARTVPPGRLDTARRLEEAWAGSLGIERTPRSGAVVMEDLHLIAIGASTGGPPALQQVLAELPPDFPVSVVIAQHMPPGFTRAFAERLDRNSRLEVKEARPGDLIRAGRALVAPGGKHLVLRRREDVAVVHLENGSERDRYVPSIDKMFTSAAEVFGHRAIGVLLTGMGDDGKQGIVRIKERQGATLAESEESSIVFGMPREAISTGAVDKVVHLEAVAEELVEMVRRKRRKESEKAVSDG